MTASIIDIGVGIGLILIGIALLVASLIEKGNLDILQKSESSRKRKRVIPISSLRISTKIAIVVSITLILIGMYLLIF